MFLWEPKLDAGGGPNGTNVVRIRDLQSISHPTPGAFFTQVRLLVFCFFFSPLFVVFPGGNGDLRAKTEVGVCDRLGCL